MVIATAVRYRLVCQSLAGPPPVWQFELTELATDQRLEIRDLEPHRCAEKLALLAVVRGLEAIDRYAEIQLVTSSRYVFQGIVYGLSQWREDDWKWEHFGRMVPIKHLDFWRRVDQALQYHRIASVELTPEVELTPAIADVQVTGAQVVPGVRVHRLSKLRLAVTNRSARCSVVQQRLEQPLESRFQANVPERYIGSVATA